MDLDAFFDAELDEHKSVLAATREVLGEPFRRLVLTCAGAARNGGRIVFFGNGGSAADAQHLATELSVRYQRDRAPIAGFALTTYTSALTAIGNDFGFEDLFARQIQALCKPEDVVIGISTSGNSGNIIKALREAKNLGAPLDQVLEVQRLGRMPVVNFAAGGIATPADAALMMQLGADGVFVGSGIFKSTDPEARDRAIVEAVTHYQDPAIVAKASEGLGEPMTGLDISSLKPEELLAQRGW